MEDNEAALCRYGQPVLGDMDSADGSGGLFAALGCKTGERRKRGTDAGGSVCLQYVGFAPAVCESSAETANLLETSGYFIILLMLIRSTFAREAGELGQELLYSLDWTTIMVLGFLLQFVGRIMRRAVKIKEKQDLTI